METRRTKPLAECYIILDILSTDFYLNVYFLSECIFYTLVSEAGFEIEYAKVSSKKTSKVIS
jgi:hypothetical protein